MANKAISELPQALNVNNQDLFVLEQGGLAKKLPAETFITEQGIIDALAAALDGHGGIQSVTLASVSGRIRTYRITFSDGSATTFQVYDGTSIDRISRTSSSGLDDVYTIFLSDGTTTFFTVHNGADGTVSEAMLNDALKDKAPVITETTESSAIATFTDGADDMPLHNILAEITPVQDLNGYDSPWPAGGGINMFDYDSAVDGYIASNGTQISPPYAGDMTSDFIPVTEGEAYVYQCYPNETGSQAAWSDFAFYSEKTMASLIGTRQASSAYTTTFTAPTGAKYVRIGSRYLSGGKASLEKGTTVSPWTPYSNICPITGHTEVNVTRCGKNLFDKSAITANSWIVVNTTTIEANTGYFVSDYIPVKAGESITCTYRSASRNIYYDENKNPIAYFSWSVGTLSPLYDGYIRVTCSNDYLDTLQIELGSSTTAYEAPQVQTVTVDWTTEVGTVYGGTIDVATGLLTVTHGYTTFNGSEVWRLGGAGQGFYTKLDTLRKTLNYSNSIICDKLQSCKDNFNNPFISIGYGICGYADSNNSYPNQNWIYAKGGGATSSDEFKTWLQSNPIQVVYELATPQTYQLTPQQLMTLLGTNNVWADIGNVSVTYPADTKLYIQNLTQPTEDDLVANQAITSGKYFMIGNSLYLALANIASGAQITIGTNAQHVSLADALNAINS